MDIATNQGLSARVVVDEHYQVLGQVAAVRHWDDLSRDLENECECSSAREVPGEPHE